MLERLCVRVESGVVLELGQEDGMRFELRIKEHVVRDAEHDAVSHCHPIARHEARVIPLKLLLAASQERPELRSDELIVLRVLRRWGRHSEHKATCSGQQLTPGVNDPVDISSLLPVPGVVVAAFDGQSPEDGTSLLHFPALVANNGQPAELAGVARAFAHNPSWDADRCLDVLDVGVVEHDSDGLSTTMSLEVLELDSVRADCLSCASVSHFSAVFAFKFEDALR